MLSRFETFILDITEINLYWHRIASNEMKQYGLKGNYAVYFTKLHHYPDGITAAQLGTLCGKDKADVSRDIAALEQAGFVRRIGEKAYRAKICLTETGLQLTDKIIQKAELAVQCVGNGLSKETLEVFYDTLDKITTNLQTLSETGLPNQKGI